MCRVVSTTSDRRPATLTLEKLQLLANLFDAEEGIRSSAGHCLSPT